MILRRLAGAGPAFPGAPVFLMFLMSIAAFAGVGASGPEDARHFQPIDVFQLEYASDPQVAPNGARVVYVRNFMDVMEDRRRSNLWTVETGGGAPRPLTTGIANDASPRWSPDGTRLAYVSSADGGRQIWVRWMDTGQTARVSSLTETPSGLVWSPDGKWIAFAMNVPLREAPFATMPSKPEGAQWAEPARVVRSLIYRQDGGGFVDPGHRHLFVVPADGGSPRQLTTGDFNVTGAPSWSGDGKSLVFASNRHADWEHEPADTEIHTVGLDRPDSLQTLTDRRGPDTSPIVSPDGRRIAYLGLDERYQGYQITQLYVMDNDGSSSRPLTADLDRSVSAPHWASDGKGLYFLYSDRGNTKLAYQPLDGDREIVAHSVGGTSIGRPYSGGSFSVGAGGTFAFTLGRPDRPADVAVGRRGHGTPTALTRLNDDLFDHKTLGAVEELVYESSADGRSIQGWIVKPPGFDASRKYPLVLEIHGGPFANYGDRFSAEAQLYAAAGYVVLYLNPRGSSSYGQEFGNLIHHNYPGEDYDDLMSGVDALIGRGYVDTKALFVTGGSGGGVLTAWIIGKTHRFRAAVVAKPVINWTSFALTADRYNFFHRYWFPGFPWDHPEHYHKRSPLSLVGNVKTPTMLLTGESDYRTPISESEQYYQALQLLKVDTAMVRIPGAGHGIAARPSNLISKVLHILQWFEDHRVPDGT